MKQQLSANQFWNTQHEHGSRSLTGDINEKRMRCISMVMNNQTLLNIVLGSLIDS